jgi:hypothetical protein
MRGHPATIAAGWISRGDRKGSAIVAVLGAVALLSLLLISMLHGIRLDRKTSSAAVAAEQARLAADSGISAAMARLLICTSNHPAFSVALQHGENDGGQDAPVLVIGAGNPRIQAQLVPLISCDPSPLASYPKLPASYLSAQLAKRLSTNPTVAVNLNDPDLVETWNRDSNDPAPRGGFIAPEGTYQAVWQYLHDSTGEHAVARYAFVMTDESARLNPALHTGEDRKDPTDWYKGPGDLSMTNDAGTLFTPDEARKLRAEADLPTEGCFERAFSDSLEFSEKHTLLTRDPCRVPDLIPAEYPEGGLPKYNLNDLATNPAWGATPYDRATNIAAIIDRNLPVFKLRDPSLPARQADLYLRRLACSIVDYISPKTGPTGPSPQEPLGRDLVPYVTQIAECCTRKGLTATNTTIESRYFVEVWNPTTSEIPAGGVAGLVITNRAMLRFGNGIVTPFSDYTKQSPQLPPLRPNEFRVIAFEPTEQTWDSPVPVTNPPRWDAGPQGNADGTTHQAFSFFWNGVLVDMSRRAGISPGDTPGGLVHFKQTLDDAKPRWQCMTIPTRTSASDGGEEAEEADQAVDPGHYNFVGDPRATFLTAYKWPVVTDYRSKSYWNGVNPAGNRQGGYILDPMNTWTRRDRIPLNPVTGINPASALQSPDLIPSNYGTTPASSEAPFVLRKGPMVSLGELGNIFDPAQVSDSGEAPNAGTPKKTPYCCGGGRTLRVGQPEFHACSPKFDWDVEGKRAVQLIDLFTVNEPGRRPGTNAQATQDETPGIPGRINVNTAPHAVLTSLFTGLAVTSDRRFTNSMISAGAADELATLLEKNRPYPRLSDLSVLTTNLVNAECYLPWLSKNIPGSSPPVADVFDRAREEAFGKIIGHCTVQSRTFRITVLGEALDPSGQPSAKSLFQGLIRLNPDSSGRLIPTLHDDCWH